MPRDLRSGDRGPDVKAVQEALNIRRPPGQKPIAADGVFGPKTDAAVRRFQGANQVGVDGVVGPITRVAIFPLATVTIQMVGMRLREPAFGRSPDSRFADVMPGRLTLGGDPSPVPPPAGLPKLRPSRSYQPVAYPGLPLPLATPPLMPVSFPNITLPVHHFELAPGTTGFLLPRGRGVDMSFSASVSGIVMIGDEKLTHDELSSGLVGYSPGLRSGGGWSVAWYSQITHVHQLNRAGDFSWQPNAQVAVGNGSAPFLTLSASPANLQVDLNDTISVSFGGPNVSLTLDPNGPSLSVGLMSFGVVGKFN